MGLVGSVGAWVQRCVGEVSYNVASVKWVTLINSIFGVGPKLGVVLKFYLGQNVHVREKKKIRKRVYNTA